MCRALYEFIIFEFIIEYFEYFQRLRNIEFFYLSHRRNQIDNTIVHLFRTDFVRHTMRLKEKERIRKERLSYVSAGAVCRWIARCNVKYRGLLATARHIATCGLTDHSLRGRGRLIDPTRSRSVTSTAANSNQ